MSSTSSSNETQTSPPACRKIGLTVNANSLFPVYPKDTEVIIRKREDLPFLVMGESVIFCLTFINPDGTSAVFGSTDVFELSGDSDYQHGDDPLMLYADQTAVNIAGDWDQANPAEGRISIRVNCNTSGFQQKLGSAESINIHLEVRRSTAGNSERSVILSTDAVGKNTVILHEVPADVAPDYFTSAETTALINNVDAKAEQNKTDITDLDERVETLEQGGGSSAGIGFPDWSTVSQQIQLAGMNTVYTASADGWLVIIDSFSVTDEYGTDTLYINNTEVAEWVLSAADAVNGGEDRKSFMVPVKSGDTFKITTTAGATHYYTAKLYPFRS